MSILQPHAMFLIYLFVGVQAGLLILFTVLIAIFRSVRQSHEATADQTAAEIRSRILQELMSPAAASSPGALRICVHRSDLNHCIDALQSVVGVLDPSHHDRLRQLVRETELKRILEDHLRSRTWWKRLTAVRLIRFLPMEEFKDDVRRLQDDPQPFVRLEAIRTITGFAENELAYVIRRWPEIGWILDHQPIDEIQARFGGPPILELEELLNQEDNPDALARLIELVPRHGGSTEFLIQMARHADVRLRLAALKVMAHVFSAEIRRELAVCLEDKEWRVRAMAAGTLASHGDPESVRSIAPLLLDKNPRVKLSAACALKKLGPTGIGVIRYMSRKMRAPEHRRMMAQVLGLPAR